LLARFPAVLANPGSHIGIMIGANDAFADPGYTGSYPYPNAAAVDTFSANLASMITQARAAGKTPFYVTPWAFWSTPSMENFPFYVDAAKALMASLSVPVVDAFQIQFEIAEDIGQTTMWDEIEVNYQHPNALGHFLIYLYAKQVLGIA